MLELVVPDMAVFSYSISLRRFHHHPFEFDNGNPIGQDVICSSFAFVLVPKKKKEKFRLDAMTFPSLPKMSVSLEPFDAIDNAIREETLSLVDPGVCSRSQAESFDWFYDLDAVFAFDMHGMDGREE